MFKRLFALASLTRQPRRPSIDLMSTNAAKGAWARPTYYLKPTAEGIGQPWPAGEDNPRPSRTAEMRERDGK